MFVNKGVKMFNFGMRKIYIFFILICSLSTFVQADEFGMTAGISNNPSGEFKLYSDREPFKLESTGIPYSLYFLLKQIKFSFLNYQSMASTDSISGCCRASAQIVTQMLSISYHNIIQDYGDFKVYFNAGIGNFQSSSDYTYSYSSGQYDDYSINRQGKTKEQFNFAPIFELGFQDIHGRGFYGLGLTYIFDNNVKYEFHTSSKKDESDEVNLGGFLVSLITGIYF